MLARQADPDPLPSVTAHGRTIRHDPHPLLAAAAAEFTCGFEEGTLTLFDRVLPRCERMVDCGAYVGFTALYAATMVRSVHAFEPSAGHHALLLRNLAANPGLAARIRVSHEGIGARDGEAVLHAKGVADSGASLFREVERQGVVRAGSGSVIRLRAADEVFRRVGIGRHTLIKMDIEGAEYEVLPAVSGLLAECRPWLHVSFHPFNLIAPDAYRTALLRLRAACAAAEALAGYRFVHVFEGGAWHTVGPEDRMDFLRQYLLRAKPVARVASAQYGFVDGLAFSEEPLPA